ncbi:hypothetical protein BYT27DRAFT_7261791 [Phlegmacium glaucopus]|nr:hypothetical protein BYT27DRAFT_7261791 [Phlegmacium glaucopus]
MSPRKTGLPSLSAGGLATGLDTFVLPLTPRTAVKYSGIVGSRSSFLKNVATWQKAAVAHRWGRLFISLPRVSQVTGPGHGLCDSLWVDWGLDLCDAIFNAN